MIIVTFVTGNPPIEYKKITSISFHDDCILITGELPSPGIDTLELIKEQVLDKFIHKYQKINRIDFSD